MSFERYDSSLLITPAIVRPSTKKVTDSASLSSESTNSGTGRFKTPSERYTLTPYCSASATDIKPFSSIIGLNLGTSAFESNDFTLLVVIPSRKKRLVIVL